MSATEKRPAVGIKTMMNDTTTDFDPMTEPWDGTTNYGAEPAKTDWEAAIAYAVPVAAQVIREAALGPETLPPDARTALVSEALALAALSTWTDTLETAMEDMPDSAELCELMRVCIERCYNMGRFITNFADVVKIPDPILVHSDLNEVVRVNMQFLETMCGERRIALVMHLSPEPVWVDLDVVLFQQVLVNIFKNAVESIGQEGTVYIRTSAGSPVLEVADTGRGIDKETASKLFSPFFSTKPNGQGIGLMLVREVLMKHHCTFSLRTGDDGLTRFTIHFPFP